MIATETVTLEEVRSCLVRASRGRLRGDDIHLAARLTEDLGIDSVRLIELKGELEDRLAIAELALEDLFDVAIASGEPLTVRSLVELCERGSATHPEQEHG